MPEYIGVPIETDPEQLAQDAFELLQANAPGWVPNAGNLDTWLLEAVARMAAEVRDVASRVPLAVFRRFGPLAGVPPIDATKATVTTTWTMVSSAGFTIPAGTLAAIRTAGDELVSFETITDTVILPGATVANGVAMAAATAGEAGSGLGAPGGPLELTDPLDYVVSVTQVAVTSGGVDAEDDAVYLNRLRTELQLLAPRPILPADFAALAQATPGIDRALGLDGYNVLHNLLSLNDASFETSVAGYSGGNAVLAQSATVAADGANSMRLTASSAADTYAQLILANAITVTPGEVITAVASLRAGTTGRTIKVGLAFYTSGNVLIGTVFYGTTGADVNTGFTQVSVTAPAPATAAKVQVIPYVVAAANAEIHYVDKVSVRRGTGTDWVPGGTAETGLERMVTVAVVDENGNAPSGAALTALAADLDAKREVGFTVFAIGPTYTQIDVAFTITTYEGYDPAATVDAAEAAVLAYLSPANWGHPPLGDRRAWINETTINRLELATVINNVQGVNRVTVLTLGLHGGALSTSDVTLAGPASMPKVATPSTDIVGTAA